MFKPEFVTFTGLDEATDIERVLELSALYPVEWGILFSKNNTGKVTRYPALKMVEHLFFGKGLRLSAHICGGYSNKILEKEEAIEISGFLMGNFERTQINIADGESHVGGEIFPSRAQGFAEYIGAKKAIIQCIGKFPMDPRVDWLFDTSGGRGREPESWYAGAEKTEAFCGYAGGISPENIYAVMGKIEEVHPEKKPFWIDMEGRVRTHEFLDLDKCEAVLKAVYP